MLLTFPWKIMRLRFAECVLDPEVRELRRGGQPVALSPRALHLLTVLLESRPRPVSQRQLRDMLWPDTHVGYTSLAQVVAEVRRATGDRAGVGRLIRTVTRFGYAFVAPVVEERPRAGGGVGTLATDDSEYFVPEGETLVGRGTECGIRLPSSRVSRVHARVRAEGDRVLVEDAGSKNGTWVNRERREGHRHGEAGGPDAAQRHRRPPPADRPGAGDRRPDRRRARGRPRKRDRPP